jgi:hypothetical protein
MCRESKDAEATFRVPENRRDQAHLHLHIILPTFWSRLVELRYLDRCCK